MSARFHRPVLGLGGAVASHSGGATTTAASSSAIMMTTVEEELSLPILLAERVRNTASEAESFKSECAELGRLAQSLSHLLRSAARLVATPQPVILYDRPVRRVAAECSKALSRALALARRCARRGPAGLLRCVASLVGTPADFRKAAAQLEASMADTKWLIAVYSASLGVGGETVLSLPPIAATDPILCWVWSYIAMAAHGGSSAADRVEAANALGNLAVDNERNKQIILEEGGVPPLLSLLFHDSSTTTTTSATSSASAECETQLAAAAALTSLASCPPGVSTILDHQLAVPTLVRVLSDSPMPLQTRVAALISMMAEQDPVAQEEFARENVIRPLITLLLYDLPVDESKTPSSPAAAAKKPTSIQSLVNIRGELSGSSSTPPHHSYRPDGGSSSASTSRVSSWSLDSHRRKERERERESPEVKLQLKTACAEALWKLSRGNLTNSRKITETKGLFCIVKLIELEKGDLQFNCAMALMEICCAAEVNDDLRRSAFKINSPAAKMAIEQLLKLIQDVANPALQVAAIKSIGSLARTFSVKEKRVISPLVAQLSHWNSEVGVEAAIALGKFASPDNFLCREHCKAIVEFGGVPPLMRLLRSSDRAQLNGFVLLCYLALHVGDNDALEQAKALTALEIASRAPIGQNPALRELLPRAVHHLELYHVGDNPPRTYAQ